MNPRVQSFVKYIVPSIASIIAAFVTAWGTIRASGTKISEANSEANAAQLTATKAKDIADDASEKANLSDVPVGIVVASALAPAEFSQAAVDSSGFNPSVSKWVPADGRPIQGSKYATITHKTQVPDLRGVFLRGLNIFDDSILPRKLEEQDPDKNRAVLSYQPDDFLSHTHESNVGFLTGDADAPGRIVSKTAYVADKGPLRYSLLATPSGIAHADLSTSTKGGHEGLETRGKNVAVYYYIRIN